MDTFSPELIAFLSPLVFASLHPLQSSGTANHIYQAESFLVRKKIGDQTDALFQTPKTEKAFYDCLGWRNPLTPELFFFDDENGDKVEAYIDANPWNPQDEKHLSQLAETLRVLHANQGDESIPNFSAISRYFHYKNLAKTELSSEKEQQILTLASPLFEEGASTCLCHNDLWAGNMIVAPKRLYLLDLEFAMKNHPFFDLASVIEENRLGAIEKGHFLRRYFGREPSVEENFQIQTLVCFHHMLWYYWALSRYHETSQSVFLDIAAIKKTDFENEGLPCFPAR